MLILINCVACLFIKNYNLSKDVLNFFSKFFNLFFS